MKPQTTKKKSGWSIEHGRLSTRLTSPRGDYVWFNLGNGQAGCDRLVKSLAKALDLKVGRT